MLGKALERRGRPPSMMSSARLLTLSGLLLAGWGVMQPAWWRT